MKKTLSFFIVIVISLLALTGCGNGSYSNGGTGLEIVTTVFPAYDFTCRIAGERANVTLLVPPGTEMHSFEPKPQDIIRIQNCQLLIRNGGESEVWMEELLESQTAPPESLAMLECVEALEEEVKEGMQSTVHVHEGHEHEEHEHEDEEHEHETEYDEHVWTSPVNAALISRAICQKLSALDPEGAEYYRANCESYCQELEELDAAFRQLLDSATHRTMVFADRFPVRYFVEEYGLDYYAAFPGCADEAEPSAKTVAFLIDRVRQENIPAVFYIEASDGKMADVICQDTGCEKLLFHSCQTVGRDEMDSGASYLSLMWQNYENLKEALG